MLGEKGGTIISQSFKQKVNSRSSIEAELIGVDDAIGFVEWDSLHMIEQFKDYPYKSEPINLLGSRNIAE